MKVGDLVKWCGFTPEELVGLIVKLSPDAEDFFHVQWMDERFGVHPSNVLEVISESR